MSDKVASVKRAARVALGRLTENADIMAVQLEQEGWKYDPPKPVLPVVSEAAVEAYIKSPIFGEGVSSRMNIASGLRAAFKVIALDAMKGRGWKPDTGITFYRASDLYRSLTGEDWK